MNEALYSEDASGSEGEMEDNEEGSGEELEEMESLESGDEIAESDDETHECLGQEQLIDGMKVVRSHTGDYSGLQEKASKAFSFRRTDRTRWKDIIYGGLFLKYY